MLAAVACGPPGSPPTQQHSVVLITIDTLRPDRLACYGHPANNTPNIDRLAAEGALFEHAYCDMPWTTGSMASVMTGHYSAYHGLRDPRSKLDPAVSTLAQIVHDHGMQTGAVVGSFPLDSVYGLNKGFETYDDKFSMPELVDPNAPVNPVTESYPQNWDEQTKFVQKKEENDWYRPDADVTAAAIQWLNNTRDGRPFFLWVHYFGPHEKYDRTRSTFPQEREVVVAYDGAVQQTDRAVGRLIDHLRETGLLDKTMVILHADHGQNLGESGYVGHTLRLDEVAVHIPMIVRYPGTMGAGVKRVDIAKNVDILPTVLALENIPAEAGPGRSLLPVGGDLDGNRVPKDLQVAYFETYLPLYFFWPQTTPETGALLGPMISRGVRTPNWKLTTNEFRGSCSWGHAPARDGNGTWVLSEPRTLTAERCAELGAKNLFRVAGDNGGTIEPLSVPDPAVVSVLEQQIHAHDSAEPAGEKFNLTPTQEEKLKSLGYLK
jgi:arylsulfatase A-like enzyme